MKRRRACRTAPAPLPCPATSATPQHRGFPAASRPLQPQPGPAARGCSSPGPALRRQQQSGRQSPSSDPQQPAAPLSPDRLAAPRLREPPQQRVGRSAGTQEQAAACSCAHGRTRPLSPAAGSRAWHAALRARGGKLGKHESIGSRTSREADLILSLVPLYPQRLSTCWNRLMLHSFPRRQQRGRSMNSTRGLGFTVKCRNRLTTSRSVRIPDWAGPAGSTEQHGEPRAASTRCWETQHHCCRAVSSQGTAAPLRRAWTRAAVAAAPRASTRELGRNQCCSSSSRSCSGSL